MTREDTEYVLNHIKKALTLNTTIYQDTIDLYHNALKRYTLKTINDVVMTLCAQWDKRYMPPVATIAELCSHKQGSSTGDDDCYKQKREKDDREYQQLKTVYAAETKEFRNAILNDKPLDEKQTAAKKQIDIYIGYAFGDRDLKKEFNKGKTAFTVCYFAHFREFLAGILPELTGKPKGNIVRTKNKPKNYGEEYFKTHTAHQATLV